MKISAVDLFCGVGGLTYGLKQAGIDVVAGIDNDGSCRYAYEKNCGAEFIEADIREVEASDIAALLDDDSDLTMLAGCAPCQPFSDLTKKHKPSQQTDSRWPLLDEFARLAEEIQPDIVSMENVPQLASTKIYEKFHAALERNKYVVHSKIVQCADYGIPQSRRRLVLIATRDPSLKLNISFNLSANFDAYRKPAKSVRDAIGKLPPIKAGEINHKDPLHSSSKLSSLNKKRIAASKQKGAWHDWPKELLPDCFKRPSGASYTAVYGRMSWDDPSPTITTQFDNYGSGRFGHPEQNRALSLREGALLQTFPKGFDFQNPQTSMSRRKIATHIGNAVPPELGEIIGESIFESTIHWQKFFAEKPYKTLQRLPLHKVQAPVVHRALHF
ncbi:MAG: DNA cytosine methyltransferase [Gammaproteobacteria bacterium AqS3]|nr:DNA cytosine methyltransferase [Gammaproteobacteria bacterium AqS3]